MTSIKVSFHKTPPAADTAIIPVFEGGKPGRAAQDLDKRASGLVKQALAASKTFKGRPGQSLTICLPEKAGFARVILLGAGEKPKGGAKGKTDGMAASMAAEKLGGQLAPVLRAAGAEKAVLFAEGLDAAHLATGVLLRSYRFNKFKTAKKDPGGELKSLAVVTEDAAAGTRSFKALEIAASGTVLARDLVNEPPNLLYPESFARQIEKELKPLGVEVEILDEKKMQKLGMGAFLAVGMGSARKPRLVIMRWKGGTKTGGGKTGGAKAKGGPLAFVGKGVTFDTGGVSLKTAEGMKEMKLDMGGAAAVVGLMKVLATRKSKAHVIGAVGLAENMPSDAAYRPGDILTSHSGKTIEVLNTDAEGRLVLADTLSYVQKIYKPSVVVDLATLTGAMMVALGSEYCGTFVNDDALWAQMDGAGKATGEKLWRMPLDEIWRKDVESPIADVQNLGAMGSYGGACTAAGFLEHFIEKGVKWAHMDIAGAAWLKSDRPTAPKGGTGFGVRVLDRLVADHYE